MTNTTVTYTHNPAAYKSFSNFTTVKDLNTAFEMWLADHKGLFGKKELQALKTIIRHSVKVAGIATIKFKSLVKVAKEKFDYIFDVRTAKRAVAKAKTLGMLRTLETRKGPKKLKGPSIYVWQPYKCQSQNVTTTNHENHVQEDVEKYDEIKPVVQSQEMAQPRQVRGEMSPYKSVNTKANIIKLLHTSTRARKACKSAAGILRVKKTAPISDPVKTNPLRFVSRLKAIVYKSLLNTKNNAEGIVSIVYAKVNHLTKAPCLAKERSSLLERALRVVEVCLNAHQNGQLTHIRNMRGFIDSRIEAELHAYLELKIAAAEKELVPITADQSVKIVEMYEEALRPAYLRGPFYDWT